MSKLLMLHFSVGPSTSIAASSVLLPLSARYATPSPTATAVTVDGRTTAVRGSGATG